MQGSRLVPLMVTSDSFSAHVLSARLQAEGIPCQLRGAFDGPYPGVGSQIEVLVRESELALASEVLLADEVDATFLDLDLDLDEWDDAGGQPMRRTARPTWQVVTAVVVLLLLAAVILGALGA